MSYSVCKQLDFILDNSFMKYVWGGDNLTTEVGGGEGEKNLDFNVLKFCCIVISKRHLILLKKMSYKN